MTVKNFHLKCSAHTLSISKDRRSAVDQPARNGLSHGIRCRCQFAIANRLHFVGRGWLLLVSVARKKVRSIKRRSTFGCEPPFCYHWARLRVLPICFVKRLSNRPPPSFDDFDMLCFDQPGMSNES
jgi:hypothetical protein